MEDDDELPPDEGPRHCFPNVAACTSSTRARHLRFLRESPPPQQIDKQAGALDLKRGTARRWMRWPWWSSAAFHLSCVGASVFWWSSSTRARPSCPVLGQVPTVPASLCWGRPPKVRSLPRWPPWLHVSYLLWHSEMNTEDARNEYWRCTIEIL
jgi:hypothetical protein